MAYNVHIHRRKNFFDREGPDISAAEWEVYVRGDATMHFRGSTVEFEGQGGSRIALQGDGFALWTDPVDEQDHWFDLRRGKISAKVTGEALLRKCSEIASKLNARVQGDEGEFYGPNGSALS